MLRIYSYTNHIFKTLRKLETVLALFLKLMFYASSSVMNVSGAHGDICSITTARRLPRKTKTRVTYMYKKDNSICRGQVQASQERVPKETLFGLG